MLERNILQKITGLEISNLPASKTDEEIKAFVEEKLESEINEISFKRKNKKVAVKIDTRNKVKGEKILDVVQQIQFISSKEKVFGNPLYCRVLKDLTPVKEPEKKEVSDKTKNKIIKSPILSMGSVTDKRKEISSSPSSPVVTPSIKKPFL